MIIELNANDLGKRLADRNITLKIDQAGKDFIAEKAYDPAYGARPIKRYLQKNIETHIAAMIIKGQLGEGDTVRVTADDNKLDYVVNG